MLLCVSKQGPLSLSGLPTLKPSKPAPAAASPADCATPLGPCVDEGTLLMGAVGKGPRWAGKGGGGRPIAGDWLMGMGSGCEG